MSHHPLWRDLIFQIKRKRLLTFVDSCCHKLKSGFRTIQGRYLLLNIDKLILFCNYIYPRIDKLERIQYCFVDKVAEMQRKRRYVKSRRTLFIRWFINITKLCWMKLLVWSSCWKLHRWYYHGNWDFQLLETKKRANLKGTYRKSGK